MMNTNIDQAHHLSAAQVSMAEALPLMVWTADPTGQVIYVSDEFYKYTGFDRREVAPGQWLTAVHPDDRDRTVEEWTRCVVGVLPYRIEFRIWSALERQYKWHLVAARPSLAPSGEVAMWYGITIDIHSSKLADIAVERADQKIKSMFELQVLETKVLEAVTSGEKIEAIFELITRTVNVLKPLAQSAIMLAKDGHLYHVPYSTLPEGYQALSDGLSIGERQGSCGTAAHRKQLVVVADTLNDPLWAPYQSIARAYGLGACWSIPVLGKDSEVKATFCMYFPVATEPTEEDIAFMERISKFLRLVIERVREQQEQKANEERFRLLATVTSDVVWECDIATDAFWYSEGLKSKFGYDPAVDQDLRTGKGSLNYVHEDDQAKVRATIKQSLAAGRNWHIDYRFRCKNGTYLNVVSQANIVRDDSGRPVRLIGSIVDVTEQVRLAEQLRQSQRLEAVGQMTGGLAHDFNNILTVIMGNAETLAILLKQDDRLKRLADMIVAAADKGAELTSRLLSFARRQSLKPVPVNMAEHLHAIEPFIKTSIGENTRLRLEVLDADCTALLDRSQLENALLNVCINSRDAMPDGGEISISIRKVNKARLPKNIGLNAPCDVYVSLAIKDTGCGMDALTMQRAFEPFYTTKEVGKGSGLGLSMVYGFIKQSHGFLDLQSEVGKGTTVTILLPHVEQEPTLEPVDRSIQDLAPGKASGHVLMVEDDVLVCEHVKSLLQELGYAVTAVNNAQECLDVLKGPQQFDLLFSDIVMPGRMTGVQLAMALRQTHPELPILLTSGYAEAAIVGVSTLDERISILRKPYRQAQLASSVARLIRQRW